MKNNYYISIVAFALIVAGCGGNGTNIGDVSKVTFMDQPADSGELASIKTGNKAFVMADREDGVKFVPITLGGTYVAGSDTYYTFKDASHQFGFGDSGSPILLPNGHTIGALSGSYGGDNILITPINKMTDIGRAPTGRGNDESTKSHLAWIANGFSPNGKKKLRDAGIPVLDTDIKSMTSQSAQSRGGSAYDVVAGRSMATMYLDGPMVQLFAVGTATHSRTKSELVAYGHPDSWLGHLDYPLPVKPARVVAFVTDPVWGSFKLGVPEGEVSAGLTEDRQYGVVVDRNATVDQLKLVMNVNGKQTIHWVARSGQYGLMGRAFLIGIDEIADRMFDNYYPGVHSTSLDLVFNNKGRGGGGDENHIDLGDVDWNQGGGYPIFSALGGSNDSLNRLTSVTVTIN